MAGMTDRTTAVLGTGECLAFWDLGAGLESLAPGRHRLRARGRPLEQVAEGPFSGASLRFAGGSWLELPRADLGALDLHGENSALSVVAWFKWESPELYQAIGGIWNETERKRQYCLFLHLPVRYESTRSLHGHISHVGGPTPGFDYCITYASSGSEVPLNTWSMLAMTYDMRETRLYRDGVLDRNDRPNDFTDTGGVLNPYTYPGEIFDGGPEGADFTIGGVDRSGEMGNWLHGCLAGFAVYRGALPEQSLRQLAAATAC
jgi:hypothetical protein